MAAKEHLKKYSFKVVKSTWMTDELCHDLIKLKTELT